MAAIRRALLSLLLLSLVCPCTESVAALRAAAIPTQAPETGLIDMLPMLRSLGRSRGKGALHGVSPAGEGGDGGIRPCWLGIAPRDVIPCSA